MTFNRSSLRLIWAVLTATLAVTGIVGFRAASSARVRIDQSMLELDAAYRELENARRLSATLTELDEQTLNENIATRLEILRHLGLEQTDYEVTIDTRQEQQVGTATLYVRGIKLVAKGSYPVMLNLLDRLHNTGKIAFTNVRLENVQPASVGSSNAIAPGTVMMTLQGNIYGLKKKEGSR